MAKAQSAKTAAKKRVVKIDTHGDVHINATFNNIIISITNKAGQVISWSSAGKMGFRGSKKNTPYAGQTAAADCGKVAIDAGMKRAGRICKGSRLWPRRRHPFTVTDRLRDHFHQGYYPTAAQWLPPAPRSAAYSGLVVPKRAATT